MSAPEIPLTENQIGQALPQATPDVQGPPKEHEPRLGDAMVVASKPFGMAVSNAQLLELAIEMGLPPQEVEEAKRTIEVTGFTNRYVHRDPREPRNLEAEIQRTARHGAQLLHEAMALQGWDAIDVFIDTSAFLPRRIGPAVLREAGFDPAKIEHRSYRNACAGSAMALFDIISDPRYVDSRVVIGANEPLSYLYHPDHLTSAQRIAIAAIFGDDHAYLAIRPGHFEPLALDIVVQPDGGIIHLSTEYDFDAQVHDPTQLPAHYRFKNGGEQIFKYSSNGAFLNINRPEGSVTAAMNGKLAGMFFGDETGASIAGSIQKHGDPNLIRRIGEGNMVIHPASKPVEDRIAKILNRLGYHDSRSLYFPMANIGRSNSSSGSILVNLEDMLRRQAIDPRNEILFAAPGIGSAIATGILIIDPDRPIR